MEDDFWDNPMPEGDGVEPVPMPEARFDINEDGTFRIKDPGRKLTPEEMELLSEMLRAGMREIIDL